jgi:hypothetical protein
MLQLTYTYTPSKHTKALAFLYHDYYSTYQVAFLRLVIFPFSVAEPRDRKHLHDQVTRADSLYRARNEWQNVENARCTFLWYWVFLASSS